MKTLIAIIIIALASFAAGLFFPWWTVAIVAFLVCLLMRLRPGAGFIAGFLSIFLLWGIHSFWLSYMNGHILAGKVSMIILKSDNIYLLVLLTALMGGLVAGLAALSGSLLRYARRHKQAAF